VDDYGSEVWRCHWTGRLVWSEEAVITAGFYPGVRAVYVSAPDYQDGRRACYQAFADNDRNCNTCIHLERARHPKDRFGFLFGRCRSTPVAHPYALRPSGEIMFHPDDAMLMKCYQSRFVA
jgi:hypothetical protein